MKTVLALLFGFLIAISAHSQGAVTFANGTAPDTRIYTNDYYGHFGLATGVNQFLVGLYTAPAGTTDESQFVLRITATNRSAPVSGLFNNTPATGIAGLPVNVTIAFEVRAWSFVNGGPFDTYENITDPNAFRGRSVIGSVVPGDPFGAGPAALFGNGPGQISQPIIISQLDSPPPPLMPEPSSTVLLIVGGTIGLFAIRSSKRRRQN